jgi:hypothetical protein
VGLGVGSGAALLVGEGHAVDGAQCDLMGYGRIGVGGLYGDGVRGAGLADPDLEFAPGLLAGDRTREVFLLAIDYHLGVAGRADRLPRGFHRPVAGTARQGRGEDRRTAQGRSRLHVSSLRSFFDDWQTVVALSVRLGVVAVVGSIAAGRTVLVLTCQFLVSIWVSI